MDREEGGTKPEMTKTILKMPIFVRMRTPSWGLGGTPYASYIAALADVSGIESQRVLGVGGNADLLLSVINGRTSVRAYTAIEPDLVTAAFFSSYVEDADIDLITTDLFDQREQTLETIGDAAFDVMIVRHQTPQMTRDNVTSLLESLRTIAAPGCKLIMMVGIAEQTVSAQSAADYVHEHELYDLSEDYAEIEWALGTIPLFSLQTLSALASTHSWALDEVYEPRRGFQQHHVVLSSN